MSLDALSRLDTLADSLRGALDRLEDAHDRIAQLETRSASTHYDGQVVERDHEKGVRLQLGTDENPFLSPWVQPGDRTGVSRYLPEKGEQVRLVAMNGDLTQGILQPLTHSDAKPNPAKNADETVHHNRDGQRHSVEKGHERNRVDRKITTTAGDDAGQDTKGKGGGANLPHELNRQLQSIVARLTTHDNQFTGLHNATSLMREIAQTRIPELAAVQKYLNKDAQSLDKSTQDFKGKLESYVAKTFQDMAGKLTNGFMGNVPGLINGFLQGDMNAVLDGAAALASQYGVDVAAPIASARAAVANAASTGGAGGIAPALDVMAAAFAGTPGEAGFVALRGQMTGILGSALAVAGGLTGTLDAQGNVVKGLTKSFRMGGYDGDE